jgi:hypothetical protein
MNAPILTLVPTPAPTASASYTTLREYLPVLGALFKGGHLRRAAALVAEIDQARVGAPSERALVLGRARAALRRGVIARAAEETVRLKVQGRRVDVARVPTAEGEAVYEIAIYGIARGVVYVSEEDMVYLSKEGRTEGLRYFDALLNDPLGAIDEYTRTEVRCYVCGRSLTDPESRARGIGPTCASRAV